ncbi:hypothetical protein EYF80_058741 [Liparis tanakae]|uniref:Uncharacterized protein n=1 Tax=Liparis tanakae TaxID=230148 RepID=A0A4Z2EQ87_9TELE|nr:hypothetical protein EYF80_058741 [Liparis tanakae]
MLGSSRISSQSTIESLNEETEEAFPKPALHLPDLQRKRDAVKRQVTEGVLTEVTEVTVSETDVIALLDIPNTVMSGEADAAMPRPALHAARCGGPAVDQSVQTLSGAVKNKAVQSERVSTADAACAVSGGDVFDAALGPEPGAAEPGGQEVERAAGLPQPGGAAERSLSAASTASAGSPSPWFRCHLITFNL